MRFLSWLSDALLWSSIKTKKFAVQPIKWLFRQVIKPFIRAAFVVVIPLIAIFFIFKAPTLHQDYIRSYVGKHVYYVSGSDQGGGTGFSVVAPSGKTYVVTNDHICASSKDGKATIAFEFGPSIVRPIVERSLFTDLCLIEGVSSFGLLLANDTRQGDRVQAVGHPDLRSLTLSNIGEIIDVGSAEFAHSTGLPLSLTECDVLNPKFHLRSDEDGMATCTIFIPRAFYTSVFVKPGNSGSPLINFYGDVVGVISGVDSYGWAVAVPLGDLDAMISNK